MNLTALQYYQMVCETGSMAKAAEQLFLSRQALSKAVRILEDEVGIELLRRKSSGIELTRAGEILYRHAQTLLQNWDKAQEELEALKREQKTLLRVGYGRMTYNLWEAGHAEAFAQAHPEVVFSYQIASPEPLFQQLATGKLDLLISTDQGDPESTLNIPIRRLPFFILLSREDPLAKRNAIFPEDLAGHPILLSASPLLSKNIQDFFHSKNIPVEFRPFPDHDPLTLLHTIHNTKAAYFSTKLHFLYQNLMEGFAAVPFRCEEPSPFSAQEIMATAPKEQQSNPILRQYIDYLSSPASKPVQADR